jgi:hypothetical protein
MGGANCDPRPHSAKRPAGKNRWRRARRVAPLLLASSFAAISAASARADCVGNCGTSGANGVVTAPPNGASAYQFVSTSGGVTGGGTLSYLGTPVPSSTNGSTVTSSAFTVNAGSVLKFSFNFVTSDGAGYSDYAWAQLRTSTGAVVATLVTAQTKATGDIIPATGTGFPPISGTLDPAAVPIIAGAPDWSPLGSSSGKCYAAGCGYTGWVNETYDITAGGTYVLVFGVSNVGDTSFDTGLAYSGTTINGKLIGGADIDTAAPFYLASNLGLTVNPAFTGGTLRMDQPGATYTQSFTLDGSTTNTIDEFGNSSIFSGVFSDAAPGTPGNIVIANSGVGGSVTFRGANTYTGTTTIDAGATLIIGGGGSINNASTLTNSGVLRVDAGGAVTVAEIANNATGSIANFGSVVAALNNAGTVTNGGGDVVGGGAWTGNVLSNTGTIFNRGTWAGDIVSNAGGISNSGTWNAANFANAATGSVINSGTLSATASFANAGSSSTSGSLTTPLIGNTGTFENSGEVTGAVNNAGTVTNGGIDTAGAGAWTGAVLSNTGTIFNYGTWTGDVASNAGGISNSGTWNAANFTNGVGGTFTSTGVIAATTAFNNAGTFNAEGTLTTPLVNNTGVFTVTGVLDGVIDHINNGGALQVDAAGVLVAGGVTNSFGGVIVNNGSLTDVLDNSGLVVNNGLYTADVNNFATGVIANTGVWVGSLLSNAGTIVNNGTWNAATFNNDAGGFVSTSGTLTATTAINNAGLFDAAGNVTAPLINNSGVFSATFGPLGGVIGTFNNSGTLNLVDAQTNDTFSATSFNGQGGRLAVDVNPSGSASSQRSDILKVTNLSGQTTILINAIGPAGLLSTPIPVIEAANVAPGTTVTIGNPAGIINYSLLKSGGNYDLVSSINTSAVSSTPAAIGAVVTALNTGFFQNASAFISEPPDPGRNQWNGGPWIRVAQGQNDIDAVTAAQNPTGVGTEPSKVRATFNGFQTGVDLGLANIEGLGWNAHLGVTAGQANIRTNDLLVSTINTQTQVPFLGVYGAVTGHNFFVDFEVREDFYLMTAFNPSAFLNGASLYGVALAANGEIGYRLNLPSSWFIEPSAAFIYSDLHENSLRMNLDASGSSYGTLVFNPFLSAIGRAGVRVGTTFIFDNVGLAVQPFATGSLWHEFEGDIQTTFTLPATSVPVSVSRVGTFGQVSGGLSAQVLQTGLTGYLRGDYRTGPNISGYAVVAGLRYQF